MAQIVINEVSDNYTYNIGRNSFATVAMPITAMWGPAFENWSGSTESGDTTPDSETIDTMLENTEWEHFSATQEDLEAFVAAYRGPSSNYKRTQDFSYQMAMTLLTAGYDVLVCRLCSGCRASGEIISDSSNAALAISAKYPGTFGNNLKVVLNKAKSAGKTYWNLVTYVVDTSGIQTAVENIAFVFDVENSTDTLLHVDEVESNFLTIASYSGFSDDTEVTTSSVILEGGDDVMSFSDTKTALGSAKTYAELRYTSLLQTDSSISLGAGYSSPDYVEAISALTDIETTQAESIACREWQFSAAFIVYQLLKDKLNYNPQRIISPGWDDQDYSYFGGVPVADRISQISPLHKIIMETAYYSRCATGMLDVLRSCLRKAVYNESSDSTTEGYAQMLARIDVSAGGTDVNAILYPTHSALFAPWGQYKYVSTGKQNIAPPSFLALLIQRAQILNQSMQYEWALPTNRKHNLQLGKFDYKVPKKLLDVWQKLEGVGVNVLTEIPELGTNLWVTKQLQ